MRLRDAVLAVHDTVPETTDAEGVTTGGGPVVPADWTARREDAGWWTLYRPDGSHWHAWRAWYDEPNDRALWLVVADTSQRDALDAFVEGNDLAAPMGDVWDAALSGTSLALEVMRRWPDYRIDGYERVSDGEGGTTTQAITDAARRLIPSRKGIVLPDPNITPLPWLLDAAGNLVDLIEDAEIRVDAIHRPAFRQTIAGYHDHEDAPTTEATA